MLIDQKWSASIELVMCTCRLVMLRLCGSGSCLYGSQAVHRSNVKISIGVGHGHSLMLIFI